MNVFQQLAQFLQPHVQPMHIGGVWPVSQMIPLVFCSLFFVGAAFFVAVLVPRVDYRPGDERTPVADAVGYGVGAVLAAATLVFGLVLIIAPLYVGLFY